MFNFFPEPTSDFASTVDWIHDAITFLSLFFTIAIVGTMIVFAIIYRKKDGKDHETPHIEGSLLLEVIWTVLPIIICVFVAGAGYIGYEKMRNLPKGEEPVEVTVWGQQWSWSFEYSSGKKTLNELVVPVGRAVKLVMSSRDVIHSLFIPGMRVKADVVKGQFTTAWFRPIKTGKQPIFCTEYCGTAHSGMLANLTVLPEAEFNIWLKDKGKVLSPVEKGKSLFATNGCNACHSVDGTPLIGPTMLNMFGRRAKFQDGTDYEVTEDYIKGSIVNPLKNIVQGYQPVMPSFEGRISEDEIVSLVLYLKSLKGEAKKVEAVVENVGNLTPEERGKQLYQQQVCVSCHSLDGSTLVGPSFKGLWGRKGKSNKGVEYTVDELYIKQSILNPSQLVVENYPDPSPMPPYEGRINEDQIKDIIAFVKSL